jgi:hypothetical protein
VQFCCSGVTGAIRAEIGSGAEDTMSQSWSSRTLAGGAK